MTKNARLNEGGKERRSEQKEEGRWREKNEKMLEYSKKRKKVKFGKKVVRRE